MTDKNLYELLNLYVLRETNDEETEIVENHLLESDKYNEEYERLKKIHDTIIDSKPSSVDEKLLTNARQSLLEKLNEKKREDSFFIKLFGQINSLLMGGYRPALSAALTLLIGLLIGYIIFNPSADIIIPQNQNEIDLDNIENNRLNISNIRFKDPFGSDGDIEINFDAVKPISFKGNINDPDIQRLLAVALTNSDNPGVRIRTVNTLSSQNVLPVMKDPKIKTALIAALKTDENDGVRREALNALMKYPYSDDLRDAFLFVLSNDPNPGLKVGAINALAQLKLEGRAIDDELRNVIENDLSSGHDNFIRLKAASLIREVN